MLGATQNTNNVRLRKFSFALIACAMVTASLGFSFPPALARQPARLAGGVSMRNAGIADLFERLSVGAPASVLR